jgi:hypothetical protein
MSPGPSGTVELRLKDRDRLRDGVFQVERGENDRKSAGGLAASRRIKPLTVCHALELQFVVIVWQDEGRSKPCQP